MVVRVIITSLFTCLANGLCRSDVPTNCVPVCCPSTDDVDDDDAPIAKHHRGPRIEILIEHRQLDLETVAFAHNMYIVVHTRTH